VGLGDAVDERLHGGGVGDVAWADLARATRCLDGGVHGRETVGAAGDEDDMTAVLREAFCDGATDAAACSSDDGDALLYDCTLRAANRGGGILQERRSEHRRRRRSRHQSKRVAKQVASAQKANNPPDGGSFDRSF
jgi:hypothetical protein